MEGNVALGVVMALLVFILVMGLIIYREGELRGVGLLSIVGINIIGAVTMAGVFMIIGFAA
jgi:hypothetical protein